MMEPIYLDNSTITRPSDRAISQLLPYLTDYWGHPLAPHRYGERLYPSIEESYRSIYKLLGAASEDTIIFTSSGAEAVNQAIFSVYLHSMVKGGRTQFVTTAIEEAPALMGIGRLEEMGAKLKVAVPNGEGVVDARSIGDQLSARTAMVSLSFANGMTGVVQPIQEIAALCKERGVYLHVDLSHVVGKLKIDLQELSVDFASVEGSLFHAPRGIGALFVRQGVELSALIAGGMEQGGYRAGCPNLPLMVAMSQACKEAIETSDLFCTEIARLRSKLEQGVVDAYPDARILFPGSLRLPHVSVIAFPGIVNEMMLYRLNQAGVCASIGGGSSQQLSLLLKACKVEPLLALSAVHFSLSRETKEEEIDRAIVLIAGIAKELRTLSLGVL